MARHVIGTNGIPKLRIPQNAHHLGEVHVAFVREDLGEIVQPAADVAHVDLVDLPSFTKILDDGKMEKEGQDLTIERNFVLCLEQLLTNLV